MIETEIESEDESATLSLSSSLFVRMSHGDTRGDANFE